MKLIRESKDKTKWSQYVLYKNKKEFYVDYGYFNKRITSKDFNQAQMWKHLEELKEFLNKFKKELKGFKIAQVTLKTTEHLQIKGIL